MIKMWFKTSSMKNKMFVILFWLAVIVFLVLLLWNWMVTMTCCHLVVPIDPCVCWYA